MPVFNKAEFLTTVARLDDLPLDALREVAFAGRSNAGKSSAINTLANHTRLAFVSKTPGRTQHLNYFRVADEADGSNLSLNMLFGLLPSTESRGL